MMVVAGVLSDDCRRLFLCNWRCRDVAGCLIPLQVNVDIYVRYEDSDSSSDDFAKVVDYNVMRDALLTTGSPASPDFLDCALGALLRAPVVRASIEIEDLSSGATISECRTGPQGRIK
jgi:hypothetical protein